jgi:hypothetical protein
VSLSQGDACLSCPGFVDLGVLLPHLAGVIVEAVEAAAGLLLVTARARAPEAACPGCGTVSGGGSARRQKLFGRDAETCRKCRWLRDNGFPAGFQILRLSCNDCKGDGRTVVHARAYRRRAALPCPVTR